MLVRKSARPVLFLLLTAALTLTACNIGSTPAPAVDMNAISTAAFNTAVAQISAQQTQTALAAPTATPTNTPLSLPSLAPAANGAASPIAGVTGLPTFSFNATNNTPLPGFTPIGSPAVPVQSAATAALGDACNNNVFVADITIPDNTIFIAGNDKGLRPGDDFQKIWRVKNTGSCKWDEGYTLVWIAGDDALDPHNVKFTNASQFVQPGATADLGINLTAPSAAGTYTETFRMQSDQGTFFGTPLTVVIQVKKK